MIVTSGAMTLIGIEASEGDGEVILKDALPIHVVSSQKGLMHVLGSCWIAPYPIWRICVRYDCYMTVDGPPEGSIIRKAYEDRLSELSMLRSGIVPGKVGCINEK